MAFPTGWNKKHKLSVDYTKVSGTANLTDFPVLLTEANFLSTAFDNSQGKEIYTNYLYSDANLQGYWRLESDGTDSGPNGYTLTGSGTPTHAAGKFGNGVDLESGSSQYYYIADASCANLEISGSQTWSAWIKPESLSTYMFIAMKQDAAGTAKGLWYDSSTSKITFTLNGLTTAENVASTAPLAAGNWYHVVGVYDSTNSKLKVFVNGVKTEGTASGSATDTNAVFRIGARKTTAVEYYFDGIVDDVAIWNRALTDAEVLGLYTGGQDLRFSSDAAGTTQLAHEVVNWDIVNDKAEIYVKIPTLSYTANTDFYVWYGNSTATPQARDLANYGSNAVWSASYGMVQHLENLGAPNSVSTSFNGANTGLTSATGMIGSGVLGSTSSTYMTFGDLPCDDSAGTLQTWFNPSANIGANNHPADYENFFRKENSFFMRIQPNAVGQQGMTKFSNWSTDLDYDQQYTAGTWYLLAWTWGAGGMSFSINGVVKASNGTTTIGAGSATLYLGHNANGGIVNGYYDEVRYSQLARSADWLVTEYNNQSSPATFVIGTPANTDYTKLLIESISLSEYFRRDAGKTLINTILSTDNISFISGKLKVLLDSIIITGNIERIVSKTVTSTIFAVEDLSKGITRVLLSSVSLVDTITKSITRTLSSNTRTSETLIKLHDKLFFVNITLAEVFTRSALRLKTLLDKVSLTEVFERVFDKFGDTFNWIIGLFGDHKPSSTTQMDVPELDNDTNKPLMSSSNEKPDGFIVEQDRPSL